MRAVAACISTAEEARAPTGRVGDRGTQNAITASPMNLSTVPVVRSDDVGHLGEVSVEERGHLLGGQPLCDTGESRKDR
jgi:hypothetical protein